MSRRVTGAGLPALLSRCTFDEATLGPFCLTRRSLYLYLSPMSLHHRWIFVIFSSQGLLFRLFGTL